MGDVGRMREMGGEAGCALWVYAVGLFDAGCRYGRGDWWVRRGREVVMFELGLVGCVKGLDLW